MFILFIAPWGYKSLIVQVPGIPVCFQTNMGSMIVIFNPISIHLIRVDYMHLHQYAISATTKV